MIKVKENEHIQVYKKIGSIITMADNLDSLRIKIASLYNERIATNELGSIALEIILKRNEAKSELENNPTLDKKHEVELRIDDLHEFERVVVSMYMLQGITSTNEKLFNMFTFMKPNYQLFTKKSIILTVPIKGLFLYEQINLENTTEILNRVKDIQDHD